MIGRHRGTRSLRWRLVGAVIAAAVGRGYEGRHRLEAAVLGRPSVTVSAPQRPASPLPAPGPMTLTSGTRLTVVPVAHSADPLVDTVPHPVIKLFPLPVAEPVGEPVAPTSADEAVFADVDAAREQQVTAELAAGTPAAGDYRGRHTA